MSGSAKMAWHLTPPNPTPFSLAHHSAKTMSSLSSVKLDDSVIQFSDTVRSLELHWTLVSLWDLTPRQYPSPVSTTYAPLRKSIHPWITLWPSLLLLLWSLHDLIMLIPSCLVVHRSMRLVFNAYSSSPLFLH